LTRLLRFALGTACCFSFAAGSAAAQTPAAAPANSGAIKLTAGLDVPSTYYFRGIKQEADPKVTLWPYGDVGITLASADKGLKSVAVNFGVWDSLHTGTSGSGNSDTRSIHYEEDFYATLTLGFSPANLSAKYIAYTSPNGFYNTVKEVDLQVTGTQKYAPYGLVAFELNETKGTHIVGADAGSKRGTYLELGAGPNWPLGKATFTVPVLVGVSLKDYYEAGGKDNRFGFFDVGGMITYPFALPAKYGAWNVHFRADYLRLGDGTMADGFGTGTNKNKAVVMGGIGLSY
jgi:hypothetical protein